MEKYLVLFSDTFLWFNNNEGLLYNCKSSNLFNFECNELILDYCNKLNNVTNLYTVKISEQHENDKSFQIWINDIVSLNMGRVHSSKNERDRVISFPPILNLRNEIEDRENTQLYANKINPSTCIREISLFLGGDGEKNDYYKQILYPYSHDRYIDFNAVNLFFKANNLKQIKKINIICSDITKYVDFNKLIELIESLNISVNYYIADYQLQSIKKILELKKEPDSTLNFYFSSVQNFKNLSSIIEEYKIKHNWIFLIDNEDKLKVCDGICQELNINNFEFWPIITGANKSFFRENVFTDISDIGHKKYTKREIFCNQAINSIFFGVLFILPTGEIYDNLNSEPLGSTQDDIIEVVFKKMALGDISWKHTRDRMKSCKGCNYRYLCPPPSSYEFYRNKFDMCFREMPQ